jgi:dTDP-4-dehydrorhamnose 3,5-epimerase
MKFTPLPLVGAHVISLAPKADDRGHFVRTFCVSAFAEAGLESRFVQTNRSFSARRGTLRGFHYQLPPSAEVKLVECTRGAIRDVVVDLRPDSPSFRQSFGIDLSAGCNSMLYVPRGVAHGFMTLTDDVEVQYMVSTGHDPAAERGLRHDDPALAVDWPLDVACISDKDRSWPGFDPVYHGIDNMRGLLANA